MGSGLPSCINFRECKELEMKYTLFCILFLVVSEARLEGPFDLSAEGLFSTSDVVAIVEVVEGKLAKGRNYAVQGTLEKKMKGDPFHSQIAFEHTVGLFSDEPNRLGGWYLVFLKGDRDGYRTNEAGYSVIEVGRIPADRGDMKLVLKRLNLESQWLVRDSDENVLWYPEVCVYASKKVCSSVFEIMRYAVKKNAD